MGNRDEYIPQMGQKTNVVSDSQAQLDKKRREKEQQKERQRNLTWNEFEPVVTNFLINGDSAKLKQEVDSLKKRYLKADSQMRLAYEHTLSCTQAIGKHFDDFKGGEKVLDLFNAEIIFNRYIFHRIKNYREGALKFPHYVEIGAIEPGRTIEEVKAYVLQEKYAHFYQVGLKYAKAYTLEDIVAARKKGIDSLTTVVQKVFTEEDDPNERINWPENWLGAAEINYFPGMILEARISEVIEAGLQSGLFTQQDIDRRKKACERKACYSLIETLTQENYSENERAHAEKFKQLPSLPKERLQEHAQSFLDKIKLKKHYQAEYSTFVYYAGLKYGLFSEEDVAQALNEIGDKTSLATWTFETVTKNGPYFPKKVRDMFFPEHTVKETELNKQKEDRTQEKKKDNLPWYKKIFDD